MEGQLRPQKVNVLFNELAIAWPIISYSPVPLASVHTSHAIAGVHATAQTLQPSHIRLCLLEDIRMAFLEDFMYRNEGFECLNFVGENWLAGEVYLLAA